MVGIAMLEVAIFPVQEQMVAFGISGGGGFMALLRSHPPLEERIDALRTA